MFNQCILWEPLEDVNETHQEISVQTLAGFAVRESNVAALTELEEGWAKQEHEFGRLCQFYDLTVIRLGELPQALRCAQPESRPFGRELGSLACQCGSTGSLSEGRYDIGGLWLATCTTCGRHVKKQKPADTKLRGDRGHWFAKITQFMPTA